MKWKMVALIVIGVLVSLFTMSILQRYDILYWDVYLFVAISFYPLALVYGRRVMIDVFYSIKSGPYSPFSTFYKNAIVRNLCKALNWIIAIVTFVFVGWIYGVYTAYQRYQMQKGYIRKWVMWLLIRQQKILHVKIKNIASIMREHTTIIICDVFLFYFCWNKLLF
mgnify:CR=1 FL=1